MKCGHFFQSSSSGVSLSRASPSRLSKDFPDKKQVLSADNFDRKCTDAYAGGLSDTRDFRSRPEAPTEVKLFIGSKVQ